MRSFRTSTSAYTKILSTLRKRFVKNYFIYIRCWWNKHSEWHARKEQLTWCEKSFRIFLRSDYTKTSFLLASHETFCNNCVPSFQIFQCHWFTNTKPRFLRNLIVKYGLQKRKINNLIISAFVVGKGSSLVKVVFKISTWNTAGVSFILFLDCEE